MGKKLFGIDIAKTVRNAVKSAGDLESLTLNKITAGTRTSGQLTGGTNPTSTAYTGKGIVYDGQGAGNEPGETTRSTVRIVGILSESLSAAVVPEANDTVTISGSTYRITNVRTDPADAMYLCEVAG